jgi:hypothetical protein
MSPLLLLHVTAGIVGILSGVVAIIFRKGSRRHGLAGNVFVVAMLTLSASATYLALMKSQMTNVTGGALTFYLVGTAWWTARRREGAPGMIDWIGLALALSVGGVLFTWGIEAVRSPTGLAYGYPAGLHFFWAFVAFVSGAGDIRILVRGGIFGRQRIVRHLWRMCLALFMATASFFLGQQKVFPAYLQGAPIFWVLAFFPLPVMIFWLVRVRCKSAFREIALPGMGFPERLKPIE